MLAATSVYGQRRATRDSLRRAHRMEETMQNDSIPTDSLGVALDSIDLNRPKKPKSIVDVPIEIDEVQRFADGVIRRQAGVSLRQI